MAKALVAIYAECFTCGKVWESRNAHGIAVQHARKYNHHVGVESTYCYAYNEPEPKADTNGGAS